MNSPSIADRTRSQVDTPRRQASQLQCRRHTRLTADQFRWHRWLQKRRCTAGRGSTRLSTYQVPARRSISFSTFQPKRKDSRPLPPWTPSPRVLPITRLEGNHHRIVRRPLAWICACWRRRLDRFDTCSFWIHFDGIWRADGESFRVRLLL